MIKFRLFFSSILVLIILFSCGKNNETKESSNVFRYNESEGITSLDPAFSRNRETMWAANHLYIGLLQMDDELNILPCIA